MFLAFPLNDKPDWRNPPWMTMLIILINVVVFFGPQAMDEATANKATRFYVNSALPQLELPRYAGYLHRQQAEVRMSRREDGVDLGGILFEEIGSLSNEIREKLNKIRPESLGAAARIQGMTPAALASIAAFVRKRVAA